VARTPRLGWGADAASYAASAVFAGLVAMSADIPLQRAWGRTAAWSYAAGAVVAFVSIGRTTRTLPRLLLSLGVMAGATLAPLAIAVADRVGAGGSANAQSEVLIVEEGAAALLDGSDPYAARFLSGPLASRPLPTKTHVPYPPLMLVFGVPRAVSATGAWADARLWFLVASLAIGLWAIRSMRTDGDGRLLVFQWLFVLPTGAMLLATGGHDVPVLATVLAGFVLADRRRADASGAILGAALAMRQTTLLSAPFVVVTTLPAGRRLRAVAWAGALVAAAVVPFLLWDARSFVEDTVLFPLGLGEGRSAARTPTLGSLLLDAAPAARTAITVVLVAAIVAATAALVLVRPPGTAAGASARAAAAYAVAIALAPAARVGYLVYPVSLLVWAVAFARDGSTVTPSSSGSATARGATDAAAARSAPCRGSSGDTGCS
jgi:Glycosyltransferase family 87